MFWSQHRPSTLGAGAKTRLNTPKAVTYHGQPHYCIQNKEVSATLCLQAALRRPRTSTNSLHSAKAPPPHLSGYNVRRPPRANYNISTIRPPCYDLLEEIVVLGVIYGSLINSEIYYCCGLVRMVCNPAAPGVPRVIPGLSPATTSCDSATVHACNMPVTCLQCLLSEDFGGLSTQSVLHRQPTIPCPAVVDSCAVRCCARSSPTQPCPAQPSPMHIVIVIRKAAPSIHDHGRVCYAGTDGSTCACVCVM